MKQHPNQRPPTNRPLKPPSPGRSTSNECTDAINRVLDAIIAASPQEGEQPAGGGNGGNGGNGNAGIVDRVRLTPCLLCYVGVLSGVYVRGHRPLHQQTNTPLTPNPTPSHQQTKTTTTGVRGHAAADGWRGRRGGRGQRAAVVLHQAPPGQELFGAGPGAGKCVGECVRVYVYVCDVLVV